MTLSGTGIKLVQRKRKGINGPSPSLSQTNLWGKKRGKAFQYSSGKHVSGWAEIQMLIRRDSFWEVMDEMVPQMLAVISPHNTVK